MMKATTTMTGVLTALVVFQLAFLANGFSLESPRAPNKAPQVDEGRRKLLQILGGAATIALPPVAGARDELFKPNPLTNPVLEQIRIWDQASADELKYGGVLAPGNAGNRGQVEAYPKLLVPILKIADGLAQVNELVQSRNGYKQARDILSRPEYEKAQFKKLFNAYGDNIYYSDGDRANLYLGGGATPRNEQSLAYLLRNDILTNLENLQAELDFLIKTPEEVPDDLLLYSKTCQSAMERYLELVPPPELKKARDSLASSQ